MDDIKKAILPIIYFLIMVAIYKILDDPIMAILAGFYYILLEMKKLEWD